MRKLRRLALDPRHASYLTKKQREVDGGADIQKTWAYARKTKTMQGVAATLGAMTGSRARCFFCGDSLGGELEHYRPKAKFARYVFLWTNLLLACGSCNRKKLDSFAFFKRRPLLVDPARDDPWDDFFFEEKTGQIFPRYIGDPPQPSSRGKYTLEVIGTLRFEAVMEGRRRSYRNLRLVINSYLQSSRGVLERNLLKEGIQDNDGYGLLEWFFLREGSKLPPFSTLQAKDPVVWTNLVSAVSAGVQGVKSVSL